ncbi:GNAT family N-acetyltransferase [Rhizobium sp. PAMB 3182]
MVADYIIRPGMLEETFVYQDIERQAAQRFRTIGMSEIADGRPTAASDLAEHIRDGRLFVASSGWPVGFILYRQVESSAYIEELDVLQEYAGRGIGSALIGRVAEAAVEAGLSTLLLSTFRDVPWNAPYYERIGFRVLEEEALSPVMRAIRDEHIAKGLDESRRVFMRRRLGKL